MSSSGAVESEKAQLRADSGDVVSLPGARWIAQADEADKRILHFAQGPVIDLGCGPGRHVQALAERNIVSMGVDMSSHAVAVARGKKLMILEQSVFDDIPRAGSWGTALLLDGNIGIGGDPQFLLQHACSLLRADGRILVDVETQSTRCATERIRLELGDEVGPWFSWAHVDARRLQTLATETPLRTVATWEDGDRTFAVLEKHPS